MNQQTNHLTDPYPLAKYDGVPPPAPDWFRAAIETICTNHSVMVDGVRISYRRWGDPNKPGLLLAHGNAAHENWFDFIAPTFMDDFHVVALTFSGMGESGWRDIYSTDQFSAEQRGVMQDAGMFEHATKPIIVGHSYGGLISLTSAMRFGEMLKGVITLDSPIFPPDSDYERDRPPSLNSVFFPDWGTAIGRFRLLPKQACENHYILDHIARNSFKPAKQDGIEGWTWKLDPALWGKMADLNMEIWNEFPHLACKLTFVRGSHSALLTEDIRDNILSQAEVPFITIENAGHHVFLDQPLDTIATVQKVLAGWNGKIR